MLIRCAFVAAALIQFPFAVSADDAGFAGASVSTTNTAVDGSDSDIESANGSIEFGFGGPVSVQLDAGQFDDYTEYDYVFAHIVYDVSDYSSVGLFLGQEDWEGDDWETFGIEGRTTIMNGDMPVVLDAAIGRAEFDGDVDDVIAGKVAVGLSPEWEAYVQAAISRGDEDLESLGLGVQYTHGSGAFVRLGADSLSGDSEDESVSIELGFNIDGGTTFGRRTWNDMFPSY